MGSPRAVTWLLVLLVLVPTGVLTWLGFKATDAFDAAEATRLRADLAATRRQLSAVVAQARATVEARIAAALAQAAARLAVRLPMSDNAVREMLYSIDALDRVGLAPSRVRLLGPNGRVVLPVTYRPVDGDADLAADSGEALLASLGRDADRAYYGPDGLAGAVRVWTRARDRFRSDRLRARADVEVARLRARGDATGETAAREAARLQDAWDPEVLRAAGRPLLLLWTAAAAWDPECRAHLRASVRSGHMAATPLTVEERKRLVDVVMSDQRREVARTPFPGVPFERVVAGGARIEVRIPWEHLLVAMDEELAQVFADRSHLTLFPIDRRAAAEAGTLRDGLPTGGVLEVGYPGGVPRLLRYVHPDGEAAIAARASRRLLIPIAVLCLFLVTVLGLLLTGRALRRERAARRLRDEFIANVTHEVRTPLTSVLLHAEMLADEETDAARRREHADVVQAQGARLAALVDDLLDFAALERGTRRLEPAPVDLARACEETLAPYRVLADRDGTELRCEVGDAEVAALADATGLARILANLVGNAWRHGRPSRDGRPGRIRVRCLVAGGQPAVEVRDDGPGIPVAERAGVFERFARGAGAGTTAGTGIGLALSRDLARAMGGELEVVDAPGETVFRLRLPPVPEIDA